MTHIRPKLFAILGAVTVVAGAVCTMAFAVAQTSCQGWTGSSTINPRLVNGCSGDAWGARVGMVVLIVGAVLILLAAVAATPRYSDRRDARARADQPPSA